MPYEREELVEVTFSNNGRHVTFAQRRSDRCMLAVWKLKLLPSFFSACKLQTKNANRKNSKGYTVTPLFYQQLT